MTDFEYWKPRPKRHSFMWLALLLPAVIYSVGVIVYAHAAFSPADIAANGHAFGSLLMVIGGEIGTLAAASEVFRKSRVETGERRAVLFGLLSIRSTEANSLDWLGLLVSLVATLGNLFVVYAAITTLDDGWVQTVRSYGPLVLLLCSGLDFYANVMEFGFFNASFDERMEKWLLNRHNAELAWKRRESATEAQPDASQAQPERNTKALAQMSEAQSDEESDGETHSAHECEYCGRTFGSKQAVSAHLRFCDAREQDGDDA